MLVNYEPTPTTKPAGPPKRMLELTKNGEHWHAKINYSSLDIIQTCMRKAQYMLHEKLKADSESPALTFGSAVHKALECYYQLPVDNRAFKPAWSAECERLAFGHECDVEPDTALAAIKCFTDAARPLASLGESDKRSIGNGIRILRAYFAQYANDRLVVHRDAAGAPLIERSFEFRMCESELLTIDYHGTVDIVLQNVDTQQIMVADHKTTSSLGREFINRARPNHQFTGYILGARRALGIDTRLFMINGIQVAKTKCEFMRVVTERDEHDYQELEHSVISAVGDYIASTKHDIWPMSAPNPCSMWGGCQFIDVCSMPQAFRQNVLEARWKPHASTS